MRPSTSIQAYLRATLSAGVAAGALLAAAPQAGAEVGVTAAVNTDARGRAPGAAPRVLALGNNIVFNEEIITDGSGLVQILLLDGTTFTVGPNSQLTIDEFVYDPATGDAKVVASLTKGAFRFVGARTSQTEGGAIVKTPVGTIGIRGAVANISYESGQATAALVAGNSLTITDSDGTTRIVYETGYTAVIVKDGSGTTTTVRKSTPAEAKAFLALLAGKPGTSGGAGNPPDDTDVEDSQITENNSALPDSMTVPGGPKPVELTPPDQVEDDVADVDGAAQDNVDQDIEEGGGGQPQPTTQTARVLTAPDTYIAFFGENFPNAGPRGLVGSTPASDQIVSFSKVDGRLVANDGAYDLPDFSGTEGNTTLSSHAVSDGQSPFGAVSGTAYAGAGDFVAYMLGVNGDPTQPFYMIYGTPTDENALISLDTGFDVRTYTLTTAPSQGIPVPFFNNDLYGGGFAAGTYNSSNMLVIEPGFSESADVRTFQSWVSIEGTGAGQKSAVGMYAGNVFFDEDGQLKMGGSRRGSFRHDAFEGAGNMRGGVRTLPGASGGHFFGPNADNFVIGAGTDPADTYFDSQHGSGFSGDPEDGYLGDGHFGTHHVADLVGETPTATGSARNNGGGDGELRGFMAGMGESHFEGNAPYRLTSGPTGTNLILSFNAVDNAFAAQATVYDGQNDNDFVDNMLLTFGHWGEDFGQSAYIDDTYYGATQNDNVENTRLRTDGGEGGPEDLAHRPGNSNPGSFIVSGRANPIDGYQHLEGCETCDFIEWGWWGTRTQVELDDGDGGTFVRTDYAHMGTWVAGELTAPEALASFDPGDLPFGGSANYSGTALGSVSRDTVDGTAQYIASGDFDMTYDFANRNGEFFLNFDGENAFGNINDDFYSPTGHFTGELSDGSVGGNVAGNFVDDGPNVAAGVIGDFTLSGEGMSAVGTFAGVQGPGT